MFLKDLTLFTFALFSVLFFTTIITLFPLRTGQKIPIEINYTEELQEETPLAIFPEDGSVFGETPSVLNWIGGAGVNSVQVASDYNFNNIVFESNSSENQVDLTKEFLPGVYFWRIESEKWEIPSENWNFMGCFVIGPLEGGIYAPQPTSPVYERIGVSDLENIPPQVFEWLPASYDPSCPAFAKKYRMEVATDPYFNRVLYSIDSAQEFVEITDNTEFVKTIVSGAASTPYYWRVKAYDDWDKEGAWSLVSNFYLANLGISSL